MRAIQQADKLWTNERRLAAHAKCIAGVDEAGRGCLAGPVYAASVVLGGHSQGWLGVDDSKQLSRKSRERLYDLIMNSAKSVSIGVATVQEIDELNILQASLLAMSRAIRGLSVVPDYVLVDGIYTPPINDLHIPCASIVDGDATCISISAASIVAKVERDRFMEKLNGEYPGYGFHANAGYGTPQHMEALEKLGPCPWHRITFSPVRRCFQSGLGLD